MTPLPLIWFSVGVSRSNTGIEKENEQYDSDAANTSIDLVKTNPGRETVNARFVYAIHSFSIVQP